MFDNPCHHLSKVNQEKHSLKLEIDTLIKNLSKIENTLALTNTKVTNISLTNIDLNFKKNKAKMSFKVSRIIGLTLTIS